MKNILLSVVIPTKNRYSTLIPVLSSFLKYIDSQEIEFIIQDNSDQKGDLGDLLLDERVIYDHFVEPLSIKDNTNKAIEKVSGTYSIFIGDDDLLSPYIMEMVKYMNDRDMNCLIYNPGYYWWDSVDFVREDFYYKKMAFWEPVNISRDFKILDSKIELDKVLLNGGCGMLSLARYYHGIIKTSLLFKIKDITGNYLNGSSPDMGFAASLNLVTDTYHFVNYPVSVFGASKNSGGGWTASNKHFGKIEDQKHLPKNIAELWDSNIPFIWSESTIYSQTVYEILEIFHIKKRINYSALYATMLAIEPHLFPYIKVVLNNEIRQNPSLFFNIFKFYIRKKIGSYKRIFDRKYKKMGYNVILIKDVDLVMNYMKINFKFEADDYSS